MKRRISDLCLLISVLCLAGCGLPTPQADTVRHFTLSGPVTTVADGATVRPVQLAGHLRGRQNPQLNDGSRARSVTVPDHDGVILLRLR